MSLSTFLDVVAFTFTCGIIEVLIVWAGLVLGTLTATAFRVKVLTSIAVIRSAIALTGVWVVVVRMFASWWISTLAFACTIVIILSISTFLYFVTFTLTSCIIEVLIVWAGLVLWAFATTAL